MKKIILLFVMMLAVGMVSAKKSKFYASFASVNSNNNVSWNASSNTLSVWGSSANTYQMFSFEAGTLSKYAKLYIPIDNTNYAHVRIMLMNGSSTVFTGRFGSGGDKTITLSGWNSFGQTLTDEQIATITEIRIGGYDVSSYTSESPCAISINPANVYLETEEYEGNTTDFSKLSTGGTWPGTSLVSLPIHVFRDGDGNAVNKQLIGTDNGVNNYADITDYHAIMFKISRVTTKGGAAIRAFVRKINESVMTQVWAYPVGAESITWGTQPTQYDGNESHNGYYYVDLSGSDRLIGLKMNPFGSQTDYYIDEIYLVKSDVTITDGLDMADMVNDPVGANVAYDRTFTVGQKSTVCLPFALTEDEVTAAGTFYELTSAAEGKLTFEQVTETVAYRPYVFKAKTETPFARLTNKAIVASEGADTSDDVGDYTFTGTLAHQTVPKGAYGYNASTGAFSKATSSSVTIDAFRAYITVRGASGARSLNVVFDDDELTAIQTVKATEAVQDDVMYNLQGQRVGADHKGLVIKNGKKYIIK